MQFGWSDEKFGADSSDTRGKDATSLDDFASLLESARNLTAEAKPKISRSLRGIEKESQRLASSQYRHVTGTQAKEYASQMGVDLRTQQSLMSDITVDKLESTERAVPTVGGVSRMGPSHAMQPPSGSQPLMASVLTRMGIPVPTPSRRGLAVGGGDEASWVGRRALAAGDGGVVDVDRFLRLHHEHMISSSIHEAQLRTSRRFAKRHIDNMSAQWEETKERILRHLGKATTGAGVAARRRDGASQRGRHSDTTSFLGDDFIAPPHPENPSLLDFSRTSGLATDRTMLDDAAVADESVLFARRPGGVRQEEKDSTALLGHRGDDEAVGEIVAERKKKVRVGKFKEWELQFANIVSDLAKVKRPVGADASMVDGSLSDARSPTACSALVFERYGEVHRILMEKTKGEKLKAGFVLKEDENASFVSLSDLWQCSAQMMRESTAAIHLLTDAGTALGDGSALGSGLMHGRSDVTEASVESTNVALSRFEYWRAYNGADKRMRRGLERFLNQGALRFEEKRALCDVQSVVSANDRTAMRGGRITRDSLVEAYVRLRCRSGDYDGVCGDYVGIPMDDGSVDRLPLWPLVFYAFRIGDFETAARFARMHKLKGHFIALALQQLAEQLYALENGSAVGDARRRVRELSGMSIVERYAHSRVRLDEDLWQALDTQYRKSKARQKSAAAASGDALEMDPFEMVIYWTLCKRFDARVDAKTSVLLVLESVEDFIWFKLWTVYDECNPLPEWCDVSAGATEDENDYAPCTVPELQRLARRVAGEVLEISNNDFTYAVLLVQCQLFELAVDFLWENHPLECIHLGIALRWYGCLRVVSDQMLAATGNVVALERWVCKWARHMADASADYYFYYLYLFDEFREAPYLDAIGRENRLSDDTLVLDQTEDSDAMDDTLLRDMTAAARVGDALDFEQQKRELQLYLKQSPIFKAMVEDLAENSTLCQALIGRVLPSKVLIDGLLTTFCGALCCRLLTLSSAKMAKDKRGDDDHCIHLLILAGELHAAAGHLIALLSSHVTNDPLDRRKQNLIDLAKRLQCVAHTYSSDWRLLTALNADDSRNLNVCVALCQFFDAFHNGPRFYDEALKLAVASGLVPLDLYQFERQRGGLLQAAVGGHFDGELEQRKKEYARNVEMLAATVRRHVSKLLVCVMKVVCYQMDALKPEVKYARKSEMAAKLNDLANQCYDIYHFYADLISDAAIDSSRMDAQIQQLFRQSRLR